MRKESRLDIHQAVTDTIVAALERGVGEWKMPWHQGNGLSFIPTNIEGHSYRGLNVLGLTCAALNKNYGTNVWGSFRQLQAANLQVRKGEKASIVIFYKQFTVEPDPEDEEDEGARRVLKYYSVFNVEQCDGWVAPEAPPPTPPFEKLANVERVFAATGCKIIVGGDRALYDRVTDDVHMPDLHLFLGDEVARREAYYASLAHEVGHWTGAPHRLDRVKGKKFGDENYSWEEITVELAAAMLCAELKITPAVREQHAEYISHWIRVLKGDKRAIFHIAAAASRAAEYILAFSRDDAAEVLYAEAA